MLIPEHHCASQVLHPSQSQNLQGSQGSVLIPDAEVTAKNNNSVSFNLIPKHAHLLQATHSNIPKPQMTRSPTAEQVLKDKYTKKEATLTAECWTSYEGHKDFWKRNCLHSCHLTFR